MAYPTEYRYTKDHEWIQLQGNRARIGITDHAQAELGDIVFVELPAVGTSVVEVNVELESAPETINSSPHEGGWILVLEISDPAELEDTLDAAGYESFTSGG